MYLLKLILFDEAASACLYHLLILVASYLCHLLFALQIDCHVIHAVAKRRRMSALRTRTLSHLVD